MDDEIIIYKSNELNSQVKIALNFNVQYDPQYAINSIDKDLDDTATKDGAQILEQNHIEETIHPTTLIQDFEDYKDDLGRNIMLYNWKTKSNDGGFPFIEAHNYNLDSSMFKINITKPNLTISQQAPTFKYKPILLIKEN